MATDERLLTFGLGFLGIGLVCVAMLLPFIDESSVVSLLGVSENMLIQSPQGWIPLVFAGFVAVPLLQSLRAPKPMYWPLVSGVLVVGYAIYIAANEEKRTLCPLGVETVTDACQVGKPGLGVYVLGLGGLTIVASGLFFLRLGETARATIDPFDLTRECPYCKTHIRPDASVCPQCRRESQPWILKEDTWWRQDEKGTWFQLKRTEADD